VVCFPSVHPVVCLPSVHPGIYTSIHPGYTTILCYTSVLHIPLLMVVGCAEKRLWAQEGGIPWVGETLEP